MQGESLDAVDDNLMTSLLEEVFEEVDSRAPNENPRKSRPAFLAEEFESELNAVLGRKKTEEKKDSGSVDVSARELKQVEEDLNMSEEEDEDAHMDVTEKKRISWIKSNTSLKGSAEKPGDFYSDGTPKNGRKWARSKSIQEQLKDHIRNFESRDEGTKDLLVDPILLMRIINPKVSSTMLKDRMIGREAVPPSKIKKFVENQDLKDVNWVTGGAIVGKFTRKSQNGNQYCVWNITDLKGDMKVVSVFLFGTAYKEFWKLSLGVVVGILNPSLLNNKNDRTEATLRVDNSDKIMIFGVAKDYGTCKSKKSNGEDCTAVVNKSVCEYCIYHVKQIYDKASRRPELQAHFTGSGLTNLRNKVLGKNEVFYGGKSYMALKTNRRPEMEQRLRIMSQPPRDTSKMKKDQDLLQRLSGTQSKITDTYKPSPESEGKKQVKMIDLDLPVTNKQLQRAKANAIRFIRQNGPLKMPKERGKRTPEQISSLKRRLEAQEGGRQEEEEKKKMKMSEPKSLLKLKMERSGITDKFLELMNSKTENKELLNEAESEEREKYFNRLEIREKMEDKMASTYKVDCKAVRCLKCNYKSFSASELCKREKHPLKLVNAVKRFWKCGDCSNRTVSLELVPLHSCKNCGGSKWERASMLPEKKGPTLPQETLSIRGMEEKFVNSSVRNPNLNLLVPDEGSQII